MKAAKKCKSVEDMNILFKDALDNNSYVKKKLVSVDEKTKEIFLQNSGGKSDFDKLKEIAEKELKCTIEPIKKKS